MKDKLTFSAYRLPRVRLKGLARNVLTLKRKSASGFSEKANEYYLEIQSGQLTIFEVGLEGRRKKVYSDQLSETERAKLLSKRKYKDNQYVYHIMEEVTG